MKKLIIVLLIVILISIILYFSLPSILEKYKPNPYIELGYTEEDLEIINRLNNPEIVLEYEYNSFIIDLIKNNDFKEENFKRYLGFNKFNFSLEDTIFVVNNNYDDKDIEYNENILNLMKQQYYIHDNLERYLNYQNDNELDYVIKSVNSNLDYDYYTNTSPTDLSKGYLMLVNKYNYLESNYVPDNLVTIESKYGVNQPLNSEVYEQYKLMWNDAYNEGLILYINSPYRSYNTQYYLYHNYAKTDGYALADTYSARPGHSEHQTGLAFDVTSKTTNFSTFEYSNEYKWLQENGHKYGFILRYPKGQERITGYQYESWHYRYVGVEVATKIKELNITFEEYYAFYVK